MALLTVDEYIATIRRRKSMEIWFRGEKFEDPTTYPALAASFNAMCKVYELARHPEFSKLLTVYSPLVDERVNLYTAPLYSHEDAMQKTRMARALAEVLGCCSHRCTGSEAVSGLFPLTYDVDKDLGTNYHERQVEWIKKIQREDLACTATMTDPKGHRKLKPGQQPDPDMYLRIIDKNDNGVVVTGAKVNQTGAIFAHEIVIVPTSAFREDEKQYVIAGAIPSDTEGLKYTLGRTPQDLRLGDDPEEMLDAGKKYADHQAAIFFENVLIHGNASLCVKSGNIPAECWSISPPFTASPQEDAKPVVSRCCLEPPSWRLK